MRALCLQAHSPIFVFFFFSQPHCKRRRFAPDCKICSLLLFFIVFLSMEIPSLCKIVMFFFEFVELFQTYWNNFSSGRFTTTISKLNPIPPASRCNSGLVNVLASV
ncbi:hypothetical protein ABFX02_03G035000 [Erythranthe guttata]